MKRIKKFCMIPCPCYQCSSDIGRCPEHQISHFDLFDETNHIFSVRTTELSCSEKDFFDNSYVLKYPGISKHCRRCQIDLLQHNVIILNFTGSANFVNCTNTNCTQNLLQNYVKEKKKGAKMVQNSVSIL